MRNIFLIVVASIALIGSKGLMANDSSKKEKDCLSVAIAINKTIRYTNSSDKKCREAPPVIPLKSDHSGQKSFFDVVIVNITSRSIRIPIWPSFAMLTLKVIDMNGKEYLLSKTPSFGGSQAIGIRGAYILEPGGCYVYHIRMDEYKFPKSLSGQKVKIQAIYKVREITLKIRKILPSGEKSEDIKLELTKELELWHGEIRSPLREFIIN